jgi:hypothetical protein
MAEHDFFKETSRIVVVAQRSFIRRKSRIKGREWRLKGEDAG